MLPAPISWTANGEAATAAAGCDGTVVVGGRDEVRLRSSLHVVSSSRAPARATATSLPKRDGMVPSEVGGRASHGTRPISDLQGGCRRPAPPMRLPHEHLRPFAGLPPPRHVS